MRKLSRKAAKFGLSLTEEHKAIIRFIHATNAIIQARYLKTGLGPRLDQGALDRMCESLCISVHDTLKAKGLSAGQ